MLSLVSVWRKIYLKWFVGGKKYWETFELNSIQQSECRTLCLGILDFHNVRLEINANWKGNLEKEECDYWSRIWRKLFKKNFLGSPDCRNQLHYCSFSRRLSYQKQTGGSNTGSFKMNCIIPPSCKVEGCPLENSCFSLETAQSSFVLFFTSESMKPARV